MSVPENGKNAKCEDSSLFHFSGKTIAPNFKSRNTVLSNSCDGSSACSARAARKWSSQKKRVVHAVDLAPLCSRLVWPLFHRRRRQLNSAVRPNKLVKPPLTSMSASRRVLTLQHLPFLCPCSNRIPSRLLFLWPRQIFSQTCHHFFVFTVTFSEREITPPAQ